MMPLPLFLLLSPSYLLAMILCSRLEPLVEQLECALNANPAFYQSLRGAVAKESQHETEEERLARLRLLRG